MKKQTAELSRPQQTTLIQDLVALARYGLRGRRGMYIISGGLIIGGLFFGWDWLVAAGLAPILLALAPCAVMCGLGLCMMNRKGDKSCSSSSTSAIETDREPLTKSLPEASTDQSAHEAEKR